MELPPLLNTATITQNVSKIINKICLYLFDIRLKRKTFGALIGGMLGEMFATEIPILICGVSMMLFSLSWLSSSALRKLPSIDHVKLFQESNVQA